MRTFLKGALVGGLGAALVLGASTAFANHIGFLALGHPNTANDTTSLSGSVAGPELSIGNTSTAAGATGLEINVASGRPPLKVNSDKVVDKLNAERVGGYRANEISRGTQASFNPVVSGFGFTPRTSASLTVPKAGFVLLNGNAYARTLSAGCNPCQLGLRLRDAATNAVSGVVLTDIGDGDALQHDATPHATWVFPASKGTRTYVLETTEVGSGVVDVRSAVLTALFVPFGATGGSALAASSPEGG